MCRRDKNIVEKTVKFGVISDESRFLSFTTFVTLGKILTTVSLHFRICNIVIIMMMPHWYQSALKSMTHHVYYPFACVCIYIYPYAPQTLNHTHRYVYSHEFGMWCVNKHHKRAYMAQRHEILKELSITFPSALKDLLFSMLSKYVLLSNRTQICVQDLWRTQGLSKSEDNRENVHLTAYK